MGITFQSFYSPVIHTHMAHSCNFRDIIDCIAMILGSDIDSVMIQIFDRMISSSVSNFIFWLFLPKPKQSTDLRQIPMIGILCAIRILISAMTVCKSAGSPGPFDRRPRQIVFHHSFCLSVPRKYHKMTVSFLKISNNILLSLQSP